MKRPTYPVVIDYSPEDRGYVARVPALKYCTAFGETYEEAAAELQTAIDGWIAIANEKGRRCLVLRAAKRSVSVNNILAELPRLPRIELEAVAAKARELLSSSEAPRTMSPHWGRSLVKLAGTVDGLPFDYALNHDHYVRRTPKR